jgi:hypothetical protein
MFIELVRVEKLPTLGLKEHETLYFFSMFAHCMGNVTYRKGISV